MWVALDWVEHHCIVPDGFRLGRPFRLYEFQGRYLANVYLVRGDARQDLANPIGAPAFVYRRSLLVGPPKLGKDPIAAVQICLESVGPSLFADWAGTDTGYVCADHGCRCGWASRWGCPGRRHSSRSRPTPNPKPIIRTMRCGR